MSKTFRHENRFGGALLKPMKVAYVVIAALAAGVAAIGSTPSPAAPAPETLSGKSATAMAVVRYLNALTNRTTAKLIPGQHDQTNEITALAPVVNNLHRKTGIWVGICAANLSLPAQYYPGNVYVDVVGDDVYMETPSDAPTYNAIAAFGKPIALAEFGPGDETAVGRGGRNCHVYYDPGRCWPAPRPTSRRGRDAS